MSQNGNGSNVTYKFRKVPPMDGHICRTAKECIIIEVVIMEWQQVQKEKLEDQDSNPLALFA